MFSYNVNWHEDNLSVDHERRWFVRGEGKFVFHEITSSAVCRWETCCGNILLLAWTPSSSSKCIKPRFLIMLNLSFYYSSYICRNGILIDPPNTFLQSPRFCKGWFFFLTWDNRWSLVKVSQDCAGMSGSLGQIFSWCLWVVGDNSRSTDRFQSFRVSLPTNNALFTLSTKLIFWLNSFGLGGLVLVLVLVFLDKWGRKRFQLMVPKTSEFQNGHRVVNVKEFDCNKKKHT